MPTLRSDQTKTTSALLSFFHPGRGGHVDSEEQWLTELYEQFGKGHLRHVRRLLKQRFSPGGPPLTVSVTSEIAGPRFCLPLPLAVLMTSIYPEKVLATLSALKEEGYTWETNAWFDGKALPWEATCAVAWMVMRQRFLEDTSAARAPFHARHKERFKSICEKLGVLWPKKWRPTLREEIEEFLFWQGGNPARLYEEEVLKGFLAAAVHAVDPLKPFAFKTLLEPAQEACIMSAWTTPWSTGWTPAQRWAQRLAWCVSLSYHEVLMSKQTHPNGNATYTYLSPLDAVRFFRSSWTVTPLEDHRTAQLGLSSKSRHQYVLSSFKENSSLIRDWSAVPGLTFALKQLDTLLPLPTTPPEMHTLAVKWDCPPEQRKEINKAHLQFRTTTRRLLPDILSAVEKMPLLLDRVPSGNRYYLAPPPSVQKDTLPAALSSDSPPTSTRVKEVPTAGALLEEWHAWLNKTQQGARHTEATRAFVENLQAFEQAAGAPFTFTVKKDARRWTPHGYLWSRGGLNNEKRTRLLTQQGYPPTPYGYYQATPESDPSTAKGEPFEICLALYSVSLIKKGKMRDDTDEQIFAQLDAFERRLIKQGYTPDWTRTDTTQTALWQKALQEMNLSHVFVFQAWLARKGIQVDYNLEDMTVIRQRLAVTAPYAQEKPTPEETSLLQNIEGNLITRVLPAASECPPPSRRRTRL